MFRNLERQSANQGTPLPIQPWREWKQDLRTGEFNDHISGHVASEKDRARGLSWKNPSSEKNDTW